MYIYANICIIYVYLYITHTVIISNPGIRQMPPQLTQRLPSGHRVYSVHTMLCTNTYERALSYPERAEKLKKKLSNLEFASH